ncbi:MAG: hypothetical protein ACP6IU_08620 [Candidatus Asgardarchaeia archaeon]
MQLYDHSAQLKNHTRKAREAYTDTGQLVIAPTLHVYRWRSVKFLYSLSTAGPMKPKTLFTTTDRTCNNILFATFNELFDLLYELPGATKELVIGSLSYLVTAAASRSSLTFAVEYIKAHIMMLGELLKIDIRLVATKLPELYEISAFLKNLKIEDVASAVNATLTRQIGLAERYGWTLGFNIMISDAHEIPSWCKKSCKLIVSISPKKKSHHKGFRYYTSVLGNGEFWLTHAFYIDGPKESQYHVSKAHVATDSFSKAYRLGFDVSHALFDSRFFEVAVLQELTQRRLPYLMIARKTNRVREIVLEGHRRLFYHYEPMVMPTVLESREHGVAKYNLVVVPRPPEKRINNRRNSPREIIDNYVTLATNMSYEGKIGMLPEVISRGTAGLNGVVKRWSVQLSEFKYRKRSNIEVGYHVQEMARGRTNTRNEAIRVFLFGLMAILYNLYVLLRMYERYGVPSSGGQVHLWWSDDVRMWRVLLFVKQVFLIAIVKTYKRGARELVRMYKYLRNKLKSGSYMLLSAVML